MLKNENVELHKRIDQLEALVTTNSCPSTQVLQEQIEKLEQENHRLFNENQYQRDEYEQFLDQLTTMVVRTAIMQEVNAIRNRVTENRVNQMKTSCERFSC